MVLAAKRLHICLPEKEGQLLAQLGALRDTASTTEEEPSIDADKSADVPDDAGPRATEQPSAKAGQPSRKHKRVSVLGYHPLPGPLLPVHN